MVESLAAHFCRFDKDGQIFLNFVLSDVAVHRFRAQNIFVVVIPRFFAVHYAAVVFLDVRHRRLNKIVVIEHIFSEKSFVYAEFFI